MGNPYRITQESAAVRANRAGNQKTEIQNAAHAAVLKTKNSKAKGSLKALLVHSRGWMV
jgi:hypothetical protein